jgi:hypothetical protein
LHSIVELIVTSTLSVISFAQAEVANDPAVIGAYGIATAGVITAVFTGLNLNGRLKEERSKREQQEVSLEIEREKRNQCMVEVAQLRGRVAAMEQMLRGRGFL